MVKLFNSHKTKAVFVLLLTFLLSFFRIFVLINNIEIDYDNSCTGYFIEKNALTVSFIVITVILAALFVIFSVFHDYKNQKMADVETSSVIFTTALSGFMLFSTGIYYFFIYFLYDNFSVQDLMLSILMMAAAIPFFYVSLIKNKKKNDFYPYMQVFPVLLIIYRLIVDFIKQNDMPVNSSGAIHILSLIFLMLFFINDGKYTIKGNNLRLYTIFAYLSFATLMIYALPTLVLSAFWILPLNEKVLLSAVDIVLAIHVIYKVYSINNIE